MWENIYPEQKDDWACMLTIPRELQYKNGKIYTVPPKELEEMRGEGVHYKNLSIDKATKLDGVKGAVGELLFDVDVKKTGDFGFELRCSEDGETEKTVFYYNAAEKFFGLNRDKAGKDQSGVREFDVPEVDVLKFRIYLDKSSIEVFINDGEFVMSTRVYPQDDSTNIVFVPKAGNMEILSVDYYSFEK